MQIVVCCCCAFAASIIIACSYILSVAKWFVGCISKWLDVRRCDHIIMWCVWPFVVGSTQVRLRSIVRNSAAAVSVPSIICMMWEAFLGEADLGINCWLCGCIFVLHSVCSQFAAVAFALWMTHKCGFVLLFVFSRRSNDGYCCRNVYIKSILVMQVHIFLSLHTCN